ncbi:thermonuclease family protein [Mycoplasmopsis agassizii]|uniref:TNase-like domain-containing protein n=1 Tax=Mycoplasmopsis agassizii TaxID=33922 RepID=A0ABX4H663_9BACT|nr:thermonuclease family protein [Mycoplasmopsis agassizii]PAF55343.1 hypothetical protein CJF60_01480 [Mycoplasmopsis agassizii]SMC15800.1 micrococcal nuclease [Mycoplasmopsis agassizii]
MKNRFSKNKIINFIVIKKLLKLLIFTVPLFTVVITSSCIEIKKDTSKDENEITKIIKIYDGDTFYDNKKSFRLFGVDTAELKVENSYKYDLGFYYAKQAKEFTSNLILNKNIKYKLIKLDKYKRSVAKVFTDDNLDLAKKLISEGLAILAYFSTNKKDFYYYNDEKYYKELLQEQSNAQINKKGFWKESSEKLKTIFPKHYK